MAGRLTTHVLDVSAGKPAAGMALTLRRTGEPIPLAERVTNEDGRVDGALLDEATFRPGRYELEFHVAAYFRAGGTMLPEPPFLDVVVIRFGLAEDSHYHVPLLVSPFAYSTYRGS